MQNPPTMGFKSGRRPCSGREKRIEGGYGVCVGWGSVLTVVELPNVENVREEKAQIATSDMTYLLIAPVLLLLALFTPPSSPFLLPPLASPSSVRSGLPSRSGVLQNDGGFVLRSKEATHDVKSGFEGDVDPEELAVQARLAEHQKEAARLDFPTGESTRKVDPDSSAIILTTSTRSHTPTYNNNSRPLPRTVPARLRRPLNQLKVFPWLPLRLGGGLRA